MKKNIEELLNLLTGFYKTSGSGPEDLYDLVLSFLLWEIMAIDPAPSKQGQVLPANEFCYATAMQGELTKDQAIKAWRRWIQYDSAMLKEIMLPNQDSLSRLPNEDWKRICRQWISFRRYNQQVDNLMPMLLDQVENLIADTWQESAYYTPAELTRMLVHYLPYKDGASLYDPYPRSGNLLAAAAQYITGLQHIEGGASKGKLVRKLATIRLLRSNVTGAAINITAASGKPQPTHQEFDFIISNPPFGTMKAMPELLANLNVNKEWEAIALKANRTDVFFICHIISRLSAGGRAAVVVPTIYLTANAIVMPLIKKIVDDNIVDAVIKLPGDLFTATKIESAVLCLSKARQKGQPVFFMDATRYTVKDGKQLLLDEDKLLAWIDQVKTGDTKEINSATIELVAENNYRLHPDTYMRNASSESAEGKKTTAQLWQECIQLEQQLMQDGEGVKRFAQHQS